MKALVPPRLVLVGTAAVLACLTSCQPGLEEDLRNARARQERLEGQLETLEKRNETLQALVEELEHQQEQDRVLREEIRRRLEALDAEAAEELERLEVGREAFRDQQTGALSLLGVGEAVTRVHDQMTELPPGDPDLAELEAEFVEVAAQPREPDATPAEAAEGTELEETLGQRVERRRQLERLREALPGLIARLETSGEVGG